MAMQACFRARASRQLARAALAALGVVQLAARVWLDRRWRVRRLAAAHRLQQASRGMQARWRLRRAVRAAVTIQRGRRGVLARAVFAYCRHAVRRIQRDVRLYLHAVVRSGRTKTALRRELIALRSALLTKAQTPLPSSPLLPSTLIEAASPAGCPREDLLQMQKRREDLVRKEAAVASSAARARREWRRKEAELWGKIQEEREALAAERAELKAFRSSVQARVSELEALRGAVLPHTDVHLLGSTLMGVGAGGQIACSLEVDAEAQVDLSSAALRRALREERVRRVAAEEELERQVTALSTARVLAGQAGVAAELRVAREELAQFHKSQRETSRAAERDELTRRQLSAALAHLGHAFAVFRLPNFLELDEPVLESHVFTAAGYRWKMWVKPYSGVDNDAVGLYLAPARDFDEVHTADFELSIVGSNGSLLSFSLTEGRARLHKATAGHGFPHFVARSDIVKDQTLLHDGCLVVTASNIVNVRPREAI